jgi:hypothetical protein
VLFVTTRSKRLARGALQNLRAIDEIINGRSTLSNAAPSGRRHVAHHYVD